jgi:hypothetical protein
MESIIIEEKKNLAEEYIKYITENEIKDKTWNDFFEYAKVPMKHRTDFAIASILKQVMEKNK